MNIIGDLKIEEARDRFIGASVYTLLYAPRSIALHLVCGQACYKLAQLAGSFLGSLFGSG
ncbi:MAG: hypothetical protein SW833_17375 [Cyanobacteriota bacterium]|nr:hypothetical protein [Cyanobacteriota bacterium]